MWIYGAGRKKGNGRLEPRKEITIEKTWVRWEDLMRNGTCCAMRGNARGNGYTKKQERRNKIKGSHDLLTLLSSLGPLNLFPYLFVWINGWINNIWTVINICDEAYRCIKFFTTERSFTVILSFIHFPCIVLPHSKQSGWHLSMHWTNKNSIT